MVARLYIRYTPPQHQYKKNKEKGEETYFSDQHKWAKTGGETPISKNVVMYVNEKDTIVKYVYIFISLSPKSGPLYQVHPIHAPWSSLSLFLCVCIYICISPCDGNSGGCCCCIGKIISIFSFFLDFHYSDHETPCAPIF